ncbi:60S acidic ribosomal protein P2 [Geranomyces variabilis]|uniref:60S acidic ribosomal protein P2 n=1 Tax=Geranomyces variabilis TaxID=109894 RepID=A0AAD5TBQ7_9FUNG|nr:60S acidic ribosomal protein P2 [Geranomyces variabilis]
MFMYFKLVQPRLLKDSELQPMPRIRDQIRDTGNTATGTSIKMKLLAAYMLATLGGNNSPSAADVKKILSSVGVDAEEERLTKLISELNGKDINELIAEGSKKLASMPAGGAASGGAAPAAGGAAAAAPKEEKKEEVKEESDDDMDAFGLFD